MATHELSPEPDDENGFAADPDDHWGLPERTAQDAPDWTQEEQRKMRAMAAVALKIRGADYGEIASALDYATPAAARHAVESQLAAVAEHDGPQAWTTQRNLARLRYEGLLAGAFPIATDPTDEGYFQALRAATVLVDRITLLDGLNAPSRHVIYTPEATEFEQVMTEVLARSGIKSPTEGDIFELEANPIPLDDADPDEIEEYEDAEVIDDGEQ